MANALTDMLEKILVPLGDKSKLVLGWFERELQTRMVITHCDDGSADEKGEPLAWKLGGKSVLDSTCTIFAMFLDEERGDVLAYSFKAVEVATTGGEKVGAIQFFKEHIVAPKHIHGPISHEALFVDLEALFVEEEAPQAQRNGAAAHARS